MRLPQSERRRRRALPADGRRRSRSIDVRGGASFAGGRPREASVPPPTSATPRSRLVVLRARRVAATGGVLLQPVLDLPDADPEDLGGPRRGAAHHLEGPQDRLALDLVERRAGDERARGALARPRAPERRRQVVGGQLRPLAEHHRALDDVLELADVARPVVGEQRVERARREAADLLAVRLGVLVDEVRHQGGDVALARAQRRQGHRHDVQPVVEVLAELAALHLGGEVAVRRRDEPHVDLDGLHPAHPLELLLLEDAEELDLEGGRDVADLVEEERAAVGELEAPLLAADGAGEGALLVAEELGLEERLGEGRAVHLDEGLVGARRLLVKRLGDELLAGAGLAQDEDGGAGRARRASRPRRPPAARGRRRRCCGTGTARGRARAGWRCRAGAGASRAPSRGRRGPRSRRAA